VGLHGRHSSPQLPVRSITRGLLASLQEDPGLRLAETTARPAGTFTGGGLVVQRFLRPPTGPNDPGSIEMAPVSVNARRALNRMRGRPGGGW